MKFFKSLMFIAVAAMAFTACQKEEGVAEQTGVKVDFTTVANDTRTHFGEADGSKYPTLWTGNETVAVSLNYASQVEANVTASEDFKTANFNATLEDDNSGAYTIFALSPAAALYNAINASYKSWSIEIPTEQTPSVVSCDEAAQIIAAKSATTDALPTSVDLTFKHVTAYGKMSLVNLELGDAAIKSVTLVAANNIAGRYYFYPENDEIEANSSSASKIITINTNSTEDLWFACAPTTALANTELEVIVTTDQGTLSKTITLPENFTFTAGRIAKFAVNMANATAAGVVKFELLRSGANLATGDQVIIAGAAFDTAMSTTQKSNNRAQASVTKEENYIVSPGADVEIFNVVKLSDEDGEFNYYAFESSTGNYLYAPGGGNYLRSSGSVYNNSLWTVNVQNDGVSAIVNENDINQRYLRYNDYSELFSCYASGAQNDVALYIKKGDGNYVADPIFVATATETSLATESTEAFFTVKSNVEWTAEITSEGASFEEGATTTTLTGSDVAEVYLYFAANTESSAKQHTVKVTTTADATTKEYTFTFTQAAVVSENPTPASYSYVKVTEAPADWSGTYLLVNEANSGIYTCVDAASNYSEATISNGTIEYSDAVSKYEVIIAPYSTGYSIQINASADTNAEKFIQGKGSSSNGTNFYASASIVTTLAMADGGSVTITNNTNIFAFNSGAGNLRFRFFKASTVNGNTAQYLKPALYKKVEVTE